MIRALTAAFLLQFMLTPPAFAEDALRQAASAYASFQDDATVIRDAQVETASAMDLVLERAARHEPVALARGFVAYGAMSAAQSRAFADGVRGRVRAAGRAAVLRQLRNDMTYARRRPPGSAEAIRIVLDMAAADGARLNAIATRYEAYGRTLSGTALHHNETERNARDVRLRASATTTPALPTHLAPRLVLEPASVSPLSDVRAFGGRHFWDGLSDAPFDEGPSPPVWRERGDPDAINRMLTLAALLIVGASDNEDARVNAVLNDATGAQCLRMAQLTFRQCVSVAYGADEDAFCLARHGLREQGACFAAITQAP